MTRSEYESLRPGAVIEAYTGARRVVVDPGRTVCGLRPIGKTRYKNRLAWYDRNRIIKDFSVTDETETLAEHELEEIQRNAPKSPVDTKLKAV